VVLLPLAHEEGHEHLEQQVQRQPTIAIHRHSEGHSTGEQPQLSTRS
jgi:hypothetical protein